MKILLHTLFLFCIFCSIEVSSSVDENARFVSYLEKEWEYELSQNPLYATAMGKKGYETLWRDESLKAIERRKQHIKDSLLELKSFNPNLLSDSNKLNLRLYIQLTEDDLKLKKYKRHLMPFNHRGGIQLAHIGSERIQFKDLQDYIFWLERLKNLDKRISQIIELARSGLDNGYRAPEVLMERVYRQIKIQINKDIEEHPFYQIFKDIPATVPASERIKIQNEAKLVIKDLIIPSYELLEDFFLSEYLPQTRKTVGLYDTPNGKELYEQLAKSFTTTNLTPQEIHNIGLKEVKRIRGEMEGVMEEVNFKGTFKEFLTFLREDKRFYYETSEELFEGYLAVSKRIDPELVSLFGKLPRTPYGLRPIPMESAPDTTTAYYMAPAPGGLRPGYYYVNLYKPETRPKYEMEVLSVHEAVPGHHLQICLLYTSPSPRDRG